MSGRLRSFLLVASALGALDAAGAVERHDPPAAPGAMAPFLAPARAGGAAASWIEPAAPGGASSRVRFSRFAGEAWSAPVTIVESEKLFENWADTPGLVEAHDGAWLAWWLEKIGAGTYAYGIRLARSSDGGASWTPLGWLQDDLSEGEHGFVSAVAEKAGTRFVWLDGRATGGGHHGGPMQLRTALVTATVGPSAAVDESVCDCCPTAAAASVDGPLVAYRDRSADEIRDVHLARLAPDGGKQPLLAGRDGWKIEGCPVNGPALAADDATIALAWFTGAGDRARVQAASTGSDGAWRPAVVLDERGPLGRVSVAMLGGGEAAVGWLGRAGEAAEIRLARLAADGGVSPPLVLGTTSAGRKSGVPRLARLGDGRLLALWTDASTEPSALRGARVAAADLPAR